MKLKYQFVITELGDEFVAVAVGDGADDFHGSITLNKEACAVFYGLNQGKDVTEEELVAGMCRTFDESDPEEVKKYTIAFLDEIRKADLLSE